MCGLCCSVCFLQFKNVKIVLNFLLREKQNQINFGLRTVAYQLLV